MEGNTCSRDAQFTPLQIENCTLVLYQQDSMTGTVTRYELECGDVPRQIPGSNMFFASWTCMLSVFYVAFRWKAAQAIKFAQTSKQSAEHTSNLGAAEKALSEGDDDDDAGYDDDDDDDAI
jgi:hypothetical protein